MCNSFRFAENGFELLSARSVTCKDINRWAVQSPGCAFANTEQSPCVAAFTLHSLKQVLQLSSLPLDYIIQSELL